MHVKRLSSPLRRLAALALIASLLTLLTACPRPLTVPTTPGSPAAQATDQVSGRISFGFIHTQAGIKEDVAPGATVSLIDVKTGNTVSTTRTDSDGRFVLTYSNGFKPKTGDLYYFEAVKGLSGGAGIPNAAGSDAVRVRTIASYYNGGWVTLTSGTAGTSILISPMTTALSVIVSLRQATSKKIDPTTLFGAIRAGRPSDGYPDTLQIADSRLVTMVKRAYDLVVGSLEKDRDPLRWIQLSSADTDFYTVTLPELPFSISYLDPPNAVALETIDLVGSNFEGHPVVDFQADGGQLARATDVSVSSDLTRITVRVPPTAVTGHVRLSIGERTLTGPIFRLDTRDGHSVVDGRGNLYAANRGLGTVAILEPVAGADRTSVRTLITNLGEPTALTFGLSGFDSLFVASAGGTLWKATLDVPLDASTPISFVTRNSYSTGGASDPGGMAFRNKPGDPSHGVLYVTDAGTNRLYAVPPAGGVAQPVTLTGVALSQPRGISFGPDGRLYVANAGANNVVAITLDTDTTGTAELFASGFSMPWGIAFDNRGNCYVSNHRGNSVYRVPVISDPGVTPITYGNVGAFSSIPTPAGLDADSSGYLYVADRLTNGIYRINTLAQSQQIGFGMNAPTSTWVDASGLYMLTDSGRLLHSDKLDSSGVLRVVAQGLLTAKGLVRDTDGNFYTHQAALDAITQIRPDGSTTQVVVGVTTSDGSGLSIKGDKLYLRSTTSFDPGGPTYSVQGEVLEFTLVRGGDGKVAYVSGPSARLRTPIDKLMGLGARNGVFYTMNPRTKTFFSMTVAGTNNQSVGRSSTMTRLKADADLQDPKDLLVTPDGKIWVADYAGGDAPGAPGNGSIRVYGLDGTFETVITDIETPTHLTYDGTYVYANSYTGNYLRAFETTAPYAKVVARERTGFSGPRGFAFEGTTLYVNEWGRDRISKIDAYATGTTITSLLSQADRQDIAVMGGTIYVTSGSSVFRIVEDGGTWTQEGVAWKDYDRTLYTLEVLDGALFAISDSARIHDLRESSHRALAASLYYQFGTYGYSGIHGDPSGWGLVNGANLVSYGKGDSHSTYVLESALDGSMHRTHRMIGVTLGGMVDDGAGTVFLTHVGYGTIYRLTGGALAQFASGPYSSLDRMYGGLSFHGGKIYQAIYTKHWIDQVDATTGARTTLKLGLVTPEL